MSTCFWTDLVNTAQECPEATVPPDPDPEPTMQNFIFGPVYSATADQVDAPNWYYHAPRASNADFTAWLTTGGGKQATSNGVYPASILFTGPGNYVWQEWEDYSYARAEAYDPYGAAFGHPVFGGTGPAFQSYSDGFSFVSSGSSFIRHPTPIVTTGTRWWTRGGNGGLQYTDDGYTWEPATLPNINYSPAALAARAGFIAMAVRNFSNSTNRLLWSLNEGTSWSDIALATGNVDTLAIAMSPTQVYRASGTGNSNASFSNTTALGTATPVGGAFPKRRAWWTGTSWLVERLSTPVQIQRYTDLATAGTSVFSFPAGTTPCGSFLAVGGGRVVVPVLLSTPANHVDFYVSNDDGVTFNVVPGMRLELGDYGALSPNFAVPGFNITYRPPI